MDASSAVQAPPSQEKPTESQTSSGATDAVAAPTSTTDNSHSVENGSAATSQPEVAEVASHIANNVVEGVVRKSLSQAVSESENEGHNETDEHNLSVETAHEDGGDKKKKKKKSFLAKLFHKKSSKAENAASTPESVVEDAPAPQSETPAPSEVPVAAATTSAEAVVAAAEERWTVHLSRVEGQGLGMKIRSEDGVVSISEVVPDSVAEKSGKIAAGNFIIQVNDFSTQGANHEETIGALKAQELDIVLSNVAPAVIVPVPVVVPEPVNSESTNDVTKTNTSESADIVASAASPVASSTTSPTPEGHTVILHKVANEPIGMRLSGDKGVSVSEVTKGSSAAKASLKVGDRILSINGVTVSDSSTEDVVSALKSSSDEVTLVVASPPPKKSLTSSMKGLFKRSSKQDVKKEIHEEHLEESGATHTAAAAAISPAPAQSDAPSVKSTFIRPITLKRGDRGLGMKIKSELSSEYVFISEIITGGAASQNSELHVGDYIVSINGHETRHASHDTVVHLLKSSEDLQLNVISQDQLDEYLKSIGAPSPSATASSDSHLQNVKLTHAGEGYGVQTETQNNVLVVSGVTPKSSSEQNGLAVGDIITAINGHPNPTKSDADKVFGESKSVEITVDKSVSNAALAAKPSKRRWSLRINSIFGGSKKEKSTSQESPAENAESNSPPASGELSSTTGAIVLNPNANRTRSVHLSKPPGTGWGMKIRSDEPKNGVAVFELTPGGVAEKSGKVFVGDFILEVNNKLVANMSHDEVVEELKNHTEIDLVLTTGSFNEPERRVVHLAKQNGQPFGLQLGDANPGVRITHVDVGSVAAESGCVIGDFILEVDGKSVLTHSADDVNSLINRDRTDLVVCYQFPYEDYHQTAISEEVLIQKIENEQRAVAATTADAAMDLEQAQRVTQEKMVEVQEDLLRKKAQIDAAALEATEQTRRVESDEIPPVEVLTAKAVVQEQLLASASEASSKQLEEEERVRRVQENKMHDVQDQLLSQADLKNVVQLEELERERRVIVEQQHVVQEQLLSEIDRRNVVALEQEEKDRRVNEGVVISTELAARKHVVEGQVVAAVQAAEEKHADDLAQAAAAAESSTAGTTAAAAAAITSASAAAASAASAVFVDSRGKSGTTKLISLKRSATAGLGMKLRTDEKHAGVVSEVASGSPAAQSGVHAGYKIININDTDVQEKSTEEILSLLKEGEEVHILFFLKAHKSFGQSVRSLFTKSSSKTLVADTKKEDLAEQPAETASAPAASNDIAATPAATAAPVASEAEKELEGLRYRTAQLELKNSQSEQRVQELTQELNSALAEIVRLRAATGGATSQ